MDAIAATPRADERLSTVYLDSEDLRLARWGVSFSYRAGEGWTVKLPTEDAGSLLVRDELVFEGSPRTPPPDAVDLERFPLVLTGQAACVCSAPVASSQV